VKLSVLKRNRPIQEIDLGKDVLAQDYSETIFLIGRSKDCHIVLDHKKISREHVRIIHKNGKWFIEKTAPENVALINGEEFERHELDTNDVLSIEDFSIVVLSEDGTLDADSKEEENYETKPIITKSEKIPVAALVEKVIKKAEAAASAEVYEDVVHESSDFDIEEKIEKPDGVEFDTNETGQVDIKNHNSSSNSNDDVEFADEPNDDINIDFLNNETSNDNVEDDTLSEQQTNVEFSVNDNPLASTTENAYSLENVDNDDESTKVIQSFASVFLELFGDTAPYDRYIIEKEKTFIGRDPMKCQIVLNDSEVSTVHAVITRTHLTMTLEDLKSSNGTIYKGDRVNKVVLNHNDEFVIGGVTFTVKIRSDFLKEESSTLMAVDENQTIEVEEIIEIQAEAGDKFDALGNMVNSGPPEKSIIKRILKDDEKRKKLLYAVVVLVGLWFYFDEEKPVTPVKKSSTKSKEIKKPLNYEGQKKLTDEQKRAFSALYEIGKDHYNHGRYREALNELQKIAAVDPNFNSNLQPLISFSKEGLRKIEEEEKKRQAEILASERKAKIKDLLEKAREYTKERRIDIAYATFNDITQLDPENLEVTRMKMELDDWQREKQRKELEEAQKKKMREDKVEKLKPSRSLYLQKEWFKAISKLEEFLRIKDMDDDLTTEATDMLKVCRDELNSAVAPLIGKAKSLLEGQDLKGAYEVYQQILRIEPSNTEALNQVGDIKEQLTNRARKIYREAIIAESLSLFQDAKEKYQEVQQISPVDSDYYKKASDKLRDYLE
jgi:pSer/pThr/pTyr-binding forkhead associated (FHA) protein/tetratricopeptide (TPR) repeat protein